MSVARHEISYTEGKSKISYSLDYENLRVLVLVIDEVLFALDSTTPIKSGHFCRFATWIDPKTNKKVGLKTPFQSVADTPQNRKILEQEVRFLQEVNSEAGFFSVHFHPLPATQAEKDRGESYFFYLIIEPIFPGTCFDETIQEVKSERQVFSLFSKGAQALYKAHQKRIVHRDVKGDNLLIDEALRATLVDYQNGEREGVIDKLGIPDASPQHPHLFYAPENRASAPPVAVKPSADVYSWGHMIIQLYEGSSDWVFDTENQTYVPRTSYFHSCLLDFSFKARLVDPLARPSLESFIQLCETRLAQPLGEPFCVQFSGTDFSKPHLKISNKLIAPEKTFAGTHAMLSIFQTEKGPLRLKLFPFNVDLLEIDSSTITRNLRETKDEKINRVYNLGHHPERPLNSPFGFFEISEYLPGINLETYFAKLKTDLEIIRLLLALYLKVKELHDAGYIHGNLHLKNILIEEASPLPKVHFSNHRFSYRKTDLYATSMKITTGAAGHWHPSRKTGQLLAPKVYHDYYSLVVLFNNLGLYKRKETTFFSLIKEFSQTHHLAVPESEGSRLEILIAGLRAEEKKLGDVAMEIDQGLEMQKPEAWGRAWGRISSSF